MSRGSIKFVQRDAARLFSCGSCDLSCGGHQPSNLEAQTALCDREKVLQRAYKQLGDNNYAGARDTLTEAIKVDGTFAPAYSYRGFAWYREGLTAKNPRKALVAYREGLPDLDMAIRLDQSYAPVRRHRGNMFVATYKARRDLGQPTNDILDRAIGDLKDAVELDPTSKNNANALGEAYRVKWYQRDAQVHIQVQVIEDLQLREQPDPRVPNILAKMPEGSQVAVIGGRTPAEHGWVRAEVRRMPTTSGARCSTRATAAGRTRTISRTMVNASLA